MIARRSAAVAFGHASTRSFFEPDERERLLAQLGNSRDRLLFTLGINTGFRVSELLSLRWEQLWREGKPVDVVSVTRARLKGGRAHRTRERSRHVVLNAAAATAVREHAFAVSGSAEPNPTGWVFESAKQRPGVISRRHALHILASAAERAELEEGVSTRSLRRSFGRDVYSRSGNDLLLTQAAMGHRSVLSTQAYLRRREDEAQEIVRRLAEPTSIALAPTSAAAQSA